MVLFFILGTIADALVLVKEHQVEAIGCATVAGFILFRGTLLVFVANLIAICCSLWEMVRTSYGSRIVVLLNVSCGKCHPFFVCVFSRKVNERMEIGTVRY